MTTLTATARPLRRVRERVDRDESLPVTAVGIAIAGLPLLLPKGPGNSAPADVFIGGAIVIVLMWAASVRARVRVPYAGPVALLVVAGAVGGLAGGHPSAAVQALGQDFFMLAWCAAIATLGRTPAALGAMLKIWAWSAIGWATILIGAVATGQRALAGLGSHGGGRARFMFDHPNLAASYFAVSLFVILLAGRPRNRVLRGGAVLLMFAAVVVTGSNAALGGIAIGALVAIAVATARRMDPVAAVAVLIGLILAGAVGWYALERAGVPGSVDESQNRFLRYSVARSDRSFDARVDLFQEELDLFRGQPLTGNGPASTRESLYASQASRVKEAHSDYMAALAERGPLGAVALMILIFAVGIRFVGTGPRSLKPGFARVVVGPAALLGGAVLLAIGGITHEVLHYRHAWALFGLLAAIHASGRADQTEEDPR
jgi:O-antigen ligase